MSLFWFIIANLKNVLKTFSPRATATSDAVARSRAGPGVESHRLLPAVFVGGGVFPDGLHMVAMAAAGDTLGGGGHD
jgi:hypothetical protein